MIILINNLLFILYNSINVKQKIMAKVSKNKKKNFKLPSDKEIEDNASFYNQDRKTLAESFAGESGFIRGAKWMKIQIEKQSKQGN